MHNLFVRTNDGNPNNYYVVVLIATQDNKPLILQHEDYGIRCKNPFTFEQWSTLELRVVNGKFLVFRDGQLDIDPENTLRVPSGYEEGTIGGHAGLYVTYPIFPKKDFPSGSYILNENCQVLSYS